MKHPILTLLLLLPLACYSQWGTDLARQETASSGQFPAKVPGRHSVLFEASSLILPYEDMWVSWLGLYSLTYEYRVFQTAGKGFSLSTKAGLGVLDIAHYGLPIAISSQMGKKSGHFELSMGAMLSPIYIGSNDKVYWSFSAWPIAEIGYRYQKPEGGLVWKVKVGTTGLGAGVGWAF